MTTSPCEHAEDDGFEERSSRRRLSIAGKAFLVVGTSHPHTNAGVYVNTFGDASQLGGTVNVYARVRNARLLAGSFPLTADATLAKQAQFFEVTNFAADAFDVEVSSPIAATRDTWVTIIAYGWEASPSTFLPSGSGPGGPPDALVTAVDTSGTVTNTGNTTVAFSGLTAPRTWIPPAAATLGQTVTFVDVDGSLAAQSFTVAPSGGGTIIGAATFVMNAATVGAFGSLSIRRVSATNWAIV